MPMTFMSRCKGSEILMCFIFSTIVLDAIRWMTLQTVSTVVISWPFCVQDSEQAWQTDTCKCTWFDLFKSFKTFVKQKPQLWATYFTRFAQINFFDTKAACHFKYHSTITSESILFGALFCIENHILCNGLLILQKKDVCSFFGVLGVPISLDIQLIHSFKPNLKMCRKVY